MPAVPFTKFTALSILSAARETEIGISLKLGDPDFGHTVRTKLSEWGAGEEFTIHLMDNPPEVWIVKKGTELDDAPVRREI
jgi:hypothetical protein